MPSQQKKSIQTKVQVRGEGGIGVTSGEELASSETYASADVLDREFMMSSGFDA
jgi:hypothetical protein